MSIEIIKVIKEAEDKADALKKEANQQAKQVITNANTQALKILEEARLVAESKSFETIKIAESESQLLYDNIINNATTECNNTLKTAEKNMDVAATIILERIVKASGNS